MAPRAMSKVGSPRPPACVYFPSGIPRGTWEPERVGYGGRIERLNEWMRPLEPFKFDLLVTTNVWSLLGNGHVHGPPT